jgi:hypothetical protein
VRYSHHNTIENCHVPRGIEVHVLPILSCWTGYASSGWAHLVTFSLSVLLLPESGVSLYQVNILDWSTVHCSISSSTLAGWGLHALSLASAGQ